MIRLLSSGYVAFLYILFLTDKDGTGNRFQREIENGCMIFQPKKEDETMKTVHDEIPAWLVLRASLYRLFLKNGIVSTSKDKPEISVDQPEIKPAEGIVNEQRLPYPE